MIIYSARYPQGWQRIAGRCLVGVFGVLVAGSVVALDLQNWVQEQADSEAVLAVAASEYRDGETRFHAGGRVSPEEGAPGPDTRFQIGSVTKVFTHLLLAEMSSAGKIDYATTIGGALDELKHGSDGAGFQFANPDVADITLLELATHTSGLPRLPGNLAPSDARDPYREYDEAALLETLAIVRAKQPLGDHYAYSNLGAGLLGWLLGQVDGRGYETALRERVLIPLGLDATAFEPGDDAAAGYSAGEIVPAWRFDALAGAGALWSTPEDLLRLANSYLDEEQQGLRHDPAADLRILAEPTGPYRLTRVWHVATSDDGPIYWHNGRTGGYGGFVGFRPATGEAVAILVSGDADPTAAGLGRLRGSTWSVDAPAPDRAVTGQYRIAPEFGVGVFESDGQLLAQATGQPAVRLLPLGDDWYAVDVADASVRFLREGDRITALELVQNGVVQRAEKIAGQAGAVSRSETVLSREALAEYVGEYAVGEYAIDESARFTIRLGDDGLEARLTGQPFFAIHAAGDDRFFYRVVDAELHFERDEQGRVVALVLHQGSIRQRAARVVR